ncbi:MAG: hypothetical protein HQM12_20585 [SAR324 cluster bacterium]|nr:hypothetical protein [SAR324 cluster bacterium]
MQTESNKLVTSQLNLPFYEDGDQQIYPWGSEKDNPSFIRVFIHLEHFPLYTLDRKRVLYFEKKIRVGDDMEAVFLCQGGGKDKAPNFLDFSILRAILKLFNERMLRGGYIGFTTYDIKKLFGDYGQQVNSAQITESIFRLYATTYELKTSFKDKGFDKYTKQAFRIFDEVYEKGAKFKNGMVADKIYVKLSRPAFEAFLANELKPINLEYEFSLQYPLSRAVYAKLHSKFHGRESGSSFSIHYSVFTEWVNIKREKFYSKAIQVLKDKLDELKKPNPKTGEFFLQDWETRNVRKTNDGADFTLVFYKGNYKDIKELTTGVNPRLEQASSMNMESESLLDSPIITYSYEALIPFEKYQEYIRRINQEQLNDFLDFWIWLKQLPDSQPLKKMVKGRLLSVLNAYVRGLTTNDLEKIFVLPDEWKLEKQRRSDEEASKIKMEERDKKKMEQLLKFEKSRSQQLENWKQLKISNRVQQGIELLMNQEKCRKQYQSLSPEFQQELRNIIENYEQNPSEPHRLFQKELLELYVRFLQQSPRQNQLDSKESNQESSMASQQIKNVMNNLKNVKMSVP